MLASLWSEKTWQAGKNLRYFTARLEVQRCNFFFGAIHKAKAEIQKVPEPLVSGHHFVNPPPPTLRPPLMPNLLFRSIS